MWQSFFFFFLSFFLSFNFMFFFSFQEYLITTLFPVFLNGNDHGLNSQASIMMMSFALFYCRCTNGWVWWVFYKAATSTDIYSKTCRYFPWEISSSSQRIKVKQSYIQFCSYTFKFFLILCTIGNYINHWSVEDLSQMKLYITSQNVYRTLFEVFKIFTLIYHKSKKVNCGIQNK